MSHQSDLIATDIEGYLEQHRKKELLRLLTCGSVDDGKSTLIGRLLHDSNMVYEDQLSAVARDSHKHGTVQEGPDLALLVDGLKAEREQGITIDVAYRYFSTAKRKFIIADCPGHEQYTRNMATGASTCDLAIILVDARKGVLTQTKRHSFIVSLLGIKHVVVAVNKMDLVDYSESVYEQIKADYREFITKLELGDVRFLPLSALTGDGVVQRSERMPWYAGPTLMHLLENVHIASDRNLIDTRFPVQLVLRPNLDFRGFAGTLASGVLRRGDDIVVMPSGKRSKVATLRDGNGEVAQAVAGQSIVVTLADEIDVSRGDMLVHPGNMARRAQELEAMVVWMSEEPLVPGKEYWLEHTTRTVAARVGTVRYSVDVNTLRRRVVPTLELNHIGRCEILTKQPLFVDPYRSNSRTGAFILVDMISNATVGAGMILSRQSGQHDIWDKPAEQTLRAAESPVTDAERRARFGQEPVTLLLTGLAASGKSTLAQALERRLFDRGRAVVRIDGQNLRRGMSKDLSFSAEGRSENVRRFAEMASLLNDAGLIVIGALVAPDEDVRVRAAKRLGAQRFLLVHLDCPVDVCRARDTSGLYAKATAGEVPDFAGVTVPYETPPRADLVLHTASKSVNECVDAVLELLRAHGALRS